MWHELKKLIVGKLGGDVDAVELARRVMVLDHLAQESEVRAAEIEAENEELRARLAKTEEELRLANWEIVHLTKSMPLYENRIACVVAFVTCGDHVLLIHNKNRRGWELPGGRINSGETDLEAVERELREEAGITATFGPECRRLLGTPKPGANFHSEIFVYNGTTADKNAPIAGDDASDAWWFSRSKVCEFYKDGKLSDLTSRKVLLEWATEYSLPPPTLDSNRLDKFKVGDVVEITDGLYTNWVGTITDFTASNGLYRIGGAHFPKWFWLSPRQFQHYDPTNALPLQDAGGVL